MDTETKTITRAPAHVVEKGGRNPGDPPSLRGPAREPSSYEVAILQGLHRMHPGGFPQFHIYGGTVSYGEVAHRRERNRVARNSRRINRETRR